MGLGFRASMHPRVHRVRWCKSHRTSACCLGCSYEPRYEATGVTTGFKLTQVLDTLDTNIEEIQKSLKSVRRAAISAEQKSTSGMQAQACEYQNVPWPTSEPGYWCRLAKHPKSRVNVPDTALHH